MKWYVVKRIAWTVLATYLALSATFVVLTLSPNQGLMEATMQCAAMSGDTEECRQDYIERNDLDTPVAERYTNYMLNMATLNWGYSDTRNQRVTDAIEEAWPYSAQYAIPTLVLSTLIGYGVGIYSSYKQYSLADYGGAFVSFVGISIPNFWFALVLIMIVSVWLNLLPVYYQSLIPEQQGWLSMANVKQIVLPTVVLTSSSLAFQMRYTRAQMLEHMNQEFVKVAKAKGASNYRMLIWHVLRMAAVPLATSFVGVLLGVTWASAVIIEQIFAIPGIGLMSYNAIVNQDTPLLLATTLIPVFVGIFGNLCEDLAQIWLDPRIDYGDR
jgi:peptide/nickel transport system permease protein